MSDPYEDWSDEELSDLGFTREEALEAYNQEMTDDVLSAANTDMENDIEVEINSELDAESLTEEEVVQLHMDAGVCPECGDDATETPTGAFFCQTCSIVFA